MSLSQEEIGEHCKTILNSRRILNKIVVLCEGNIIRLEGRPSPQLYRQMEKMPDANFYGACIPRAWKQFLPQFFNCGDRNDVLNTYFTLLNLHGVDSSNSYLDPTKLFAIVDLDLQTKKIDPDYLFCDTEEIFRDLYEETMVNENNALHHRIWVTGLLHKESYFLLPQLQTVFDQFSVQPTYNDETLSLESVYLDMSSEIDDDADLESNFQRVCSRINYCTGLNFAETSELRDSWNIEFQSARTTERKNELISVLLTIRKAKYYWNRIQPSNEWTRPISTFRDQLLLEIGRFYSEQTDTARYHIPSFFKILYRLI